MTSPHIGSLNEKPLHLALKQWYAQPDDRFEVPLDGFVIDIVRDELLIEIQTRSFSAMKRKLAILTEQYHVRLVHPVAKKKWIVKLAEDEQTQLSRRKSPKQGSVFDVFKELVSFPQLMAHPNFSLHVLLIQEEEMRCFDSRRGWRRKGWITHERNLLAVTEAHLFETVADLQTLIPNKLAEPFTTAHLAAALKQPRRLAQQMAYCLREMGAIETAGKQGNAFLYTISSPK